MPKLSSFYQGIEGPIRKLVRLLRDNGWNTTCSCGHEMMVELDIYGHMDELEVLRSFLLDHGYKDFTITSVLRCINQWPVRRATIHVGWNYTIPADIVSYKGLFSKVKYFKEAAERLHRQNRRLRERLKDAKG